MSLDTVFCACGNPVNGADEENTSVLFGPMCQACLQLSRHRAGRLCQRCIDRLHIKRPGINFALDNQHPLAHSPVLDTCVDRAILRFLEGFNQHVAPTFSSCQGVDMLPGRPGRWAQEPFILIFGEHQRAVTGWAEQAADRYRISAVEVLSEGSRYHRIMVDFAETPTTWLGRR